jgi:uncharacterized delta-60 repeat protein
MKPFLLLAGLACITAPAVAQVLAPDATFGNNGLVITPQQGHVTAIFSTALQPDGKMVAVGESANADRHSIVRRYLPDGTLDASFGNQGLVYLQPAWNDGLIDVLVLPDGKILAVGNQVVQTPVPGGISITGKPFMLRLKSNGEADSTFGVNGIHPLDILDAYQDTQLAALVRLADGRIVAGGTIASGSNLRQMALVCLKADGTYDTSFGNNGLEAYTAEAGEDAIFFDMGVVEGSKIIMTGSSGPASLTMPPNTRMALINANGDGSLNTAFGTGGATVVQLTSGGNTYDMGRRVEVQDNGKILIGGGASTKLAIARFNINGTLDQSFALGGILVDATRPPVEDLKTMTDGQILVSGLLRTTGGNNNTDVNLSRFSATGAVDPSFGTGGNMVLTHSASDRAYHMLQQPDGKIVLSGHTVDASSGKASFALWRLATPATPNGLPDFETGGISIYPNPAGDQVTVNLPGAPATPATIVLTDVQGKVLYTGQAGEIRNTVSLAGLAHGMYLLSVITNNGKYTFRITKS